MIAVLATLVLLFWLLMLVAQGYSGHCATKVYKLLAQEHEVTPLSREAAEIAGRSARARMLWVKAKRGDLPENISRLAHSASKFDTIALALFGLSLLTFLIGMVIQR